MNIGALVYRTTGIMPKKEVLRCSEQIGQKVGKTITEHGKMTKDSLQGIFTSVVGKGAKKIELITTKEECVKGIQKNLGLSEELAQNISEQSLSAAIPSGFTKNKTLLNIRIADLPENILANATAHESEHALFQTLGYKQKLARTKLCKWLGQKLISQQMIASINETSLRIQDVLINKIGRFGFDAVDGWTKHPATMEGLLRQTGCKTQEELRTKILKSLYEDLGFAVSDSKKFNFNQRLIMNTLRGLLQDESRAYKVGGLVQKEYYRASHIATGKHATKSTMNSMLYDEAAKTLKQESSELKKDFLKNIFGIKTAEKSAKRLKQKGVEKLYIFEEQK